MQGFEAIFKGKKITLLGLGLLGRGVGDAAFLASCGADVTVTDTKTESELAESIERLKHYTNITFHLGGHREEDFTNADLVIKAAGVRLDSPEVATAHAAGVQVAMSTALFAKYAADAGVKIVGITGTRGKSTISHMIFHVLKASGRRVHLGGNVRGISTLAMLPEVQSGDVAVLELDSWQLQGFGELSMSPHVAVFTNLMPDHQNYYASMDEYFADKANIFRYQRQGDTLVIGENIEARVRAASASWRTPVEPIVPGDLPKDWQLNIPGGHNRHNASLASSALLALGLTADAICAGLETFDGVEGRLQLVGEKDGVKIYNDNNATTPEATIAALRALKREVRGKNNEPGIILIVGGSNKELDLIELAGEINDSCREVILLEGTGTANLSPLLDSRFFVRNSSPYTSLESAVQKAIEIASEGDIVLFSPAFASFGMFKNEYDRNDQFLSLIKSRI